MDGAVGRSSSDGGGGVVFRDHAGAFRGALAHLFPQVTKPEVAELMACRKALQVGRELRFQRLHVEMDSKEAVCMINDARRNLSMVGTIVEDIKSLMCCWQDCKVTWRRRSANKAAHTLARLAVGDGVCMV